MLSGSPAATRQSCHPGRRTPWMCTTLYVNCISAKLGTRVSKFSPPPDLDFLIPLPARALSFLLSPTAPGRLSYPSPSSASGLWMTRSSGHPWSGKQGRRRVLAFLFSGASCLSVPTCTVLKTMKCVLSVLYWLCLGICKEDAWWSSSTGEQYGLRITNGFL